MLAYELARLLTCHACNFVVTAKIHNDEQGEEYEITSVKMERTRNEAYSIVLEMVPIALPNKKSDDGRHGGNSSEDAGKNVKVTHRFHLF